MRRRISWLVLATTSTVVASFVIPLCLLVRTLAEDRAMSATDQEARNIAILVARLPDHDPQLADLVAEIDRRAVPTTTVFGPDGRALGARRDPRGLVAREVARGRRGEAFRVVDDDGGRVVLPILTEQGTSVVRSSVGTDELRRGVARAWAGIVGLGVVLLLLGLVIALRLARRVSEPVRRVAEVAHELRAGDLSARAEVTGPEETQELARALNGLAERTGELLEAERAAVADLSHRLRTPVTALRLDAEAVPDEEVASRLQAHIGGLQRTIDAIVKDARRPVRTTMGAVADAAATVRGRLEFWAALAEDQERPLRVGVADGPLLVGVSEDDLRDLVDVLVDNVFAHTPDHTAFAVWLSLDDRGRPEPAAGRRGRWPGAARSAPPTTDRAAPGPQVVLVVADDGPGPRPGSHREHGDRPGSTGLGLDIARRTAAAAGGSLTWGRGPAGGTSVEVRLPLRA